MRRDDLRKIALAELAGGPRTTEQLRIAMRESYPTAYAILRALRAEGLLQSNNPKTGHMKKWRLKPCTPAATNSTS